MTRYATSIIADELQLPAPFSKYLSSIRRLQSQRRERQVNNQSPEKNLWARTTGVLVRTWDLGFTAFGGPAVHFQILHRRFVEGVGGKEKWVDEQTVSSAIHCSPYEELVKGSIA